MTTLAATPAVQPPCIRVFEQECWECQAQVAAHDMHACAQCGVNTTCSDCARVCPVCEEFVCSACWSEGDPDDMHTQDTCCACAE